MAYIVYNKSAVFEESHAAVVVHCLLTGECILLLTNWIFFLMVFKHSGDVNMNSACRLYCNHALNWCISTVCCVGQGTDLMDMQLFV